MFGQESPGLVVALIDDARHLFVYGAGGLLAKGFLARIASSPEESVLARGELDSSQLLAHPPARDHRTSEVGGLLDVVFGPCGPGAVDDLLCAAPAQSSHDPTPQVRFRVVVAVVLRALVGDTQGLSPRYDRHPVDGVGTGDDEAEDGVTALVVGDALP